MREKRYSKCMKGTQEQKEERYPFFDVFPVKRKAKGEINERVGGFEEIFLEFAEAGLKIKELKRGDYATLFTIEGKLII